MVNALYSSQKGGFKSFTLEGVQFGWQAIIDMYRRECDRCKSGGARMVPESRMSLVTQGCFKIMQVGLHITISVFVSLKHTAGACFNGAVSLCVTITAPFLNSKCQVYTPRLV